MTHTMGIATRARAAGLARLDSPCARPTASNATRRSAMKCASSVESRKTSMDHCGQRAMASRYGGCLNALLSAPADSLPCEEDETHQATAPSDGATGSAVGSHLLGRVK